MRFPGTMVTCTVLATLLTAAVSSCNEPTESPTAPAAEPMPVPMASAVLRVLQVSSGAAHSCAVASDNRAYCWGWNVFGQVGDGTTSFERLTPRLVVGGLEFRQISAGSYHTCGVTMDNAAYCWGGGDAVLGNGSASPSLRPVRVAGGLSFRQVSAGNSHTCGVTTENRAFCWGSNVFGELGTGNTFDTPALSPAAVVGSHRFKGVSVGVYHSCGVTMTGRAYCWGGDQWGQIGDGAASGTCEVPNLLPCRTRPTLVAGGHQWGQLDAGGGHGPGEGSTEAFAGGRTCGVTIDNRAFCWGVGTLGQNGDGTRSLRSAPSAVAGELSFRTVSTGVWHTCGVTTNNRAYCWGHNTSGQIGDGTEGTTRLRPRRVLGGLAFERVIAGGNSCGWTTAGAGYCWGFNVGNGTDDNYLTPQPIGGAS